MAIFGNVILNVTYVFEELTDFIFVSGNRNQLNLAFGGVSRQDPVFGKKVTDPLDLRLRKNRFFPIDGVLVLNKTFKDLL